MRLLPWLGTIVLALAMSLALASKADARHFWQTFGSTMPAADGSGCTWNWNSDYFVPRYPSSCRYGLFSPCKTTCTTSPACKWCHPYYPGYCSPYGPCHYRRYNHVYQRKCGCTPIAACPQRCRSNKDCACTSGGMCTGGCKASGCTATMCCAEDGCCHQGQCNSTACHCAYGAYAPLYNVEQPEYAILGSIPVDSSELLTRTDLSQIGGAGGQLLQQPQGVLEQLQNLPSLQGLGLPQLPQPEQNQRTNR